MDRLRSKGANLGLSEDEIQQALSLGRSKQELAWVMCSDLTSRAQELAREVFEEERILEYECYDAQWRSQGRGVVTLKDWEDRENCLFTGSHGPASDGYYSWYAEHQMGLENGLYHVCAGQASKCRQRKPRGDNRELIHRDKWRLLTPLEMVETPYLKDLGVRMGEGLLSSAARAKKATAPSLGSGLDALLEGEGPEAEAPKPEKEKDPKSPRSRSPRRGRESMGKFLARQAAKQGDVEPGDKKKKKKDEKEKKARRQKRASSASISKEESDSSSFQLAPARGGSELWRIAQKKPGQLTRLALDEMTRYLADKSEAGDLDSRWQGQKVTAYLNQITLGAHPPAKAGVRMVRELQTLAVTLDHILAGRLPQATDTLLQRYQACGMSLWENSWATARHLEIIPPSMASLVRTEERELATRQELKAVKLKESLRRTEKG